MNKNDLYNAIVNRKVGMAESSLLSLPQLAINQAMYRLDIELHKSTLKWGVGRLLSLASPELKAKWDTQMEKLNAAILAGDVPLVEELVVGSCRGVMALERSASAAGHVPFEPQWWEVAVKGAEEGQETVYRVVRHVSELGVLKPSPDRVDVDLEGLVRVYHQRIAEAFCGAKREVGKEYVASGKPMNEEIPF